MNESVTVQSSLRQVEPPASGTGRATGNTMDLLSTSSAEFEDLSTTESECDREYTNMEAGLLPSQPARKKLVYLLIFIILLRLVLFGRLVFRLLPTFPSDSISNICANCQQMISYVQTVSKL